MAETDILDISDSTPPSVDLSPQLLEQASSPAAGGSRDFMADVGYDPDKTRGVMSDLAGQRQQKMDREGFVDRQQNARLEEDRQLMRRAYDATGAAKDAMPPPWNADKERQDRISGPMEQFGSIGSVFAMMASAFTRTPMTSALNAGAAAMTAIQKSDEKGYESAYAAWKENTNLAMKRFEMERSRFTDANQLMTSDMNAWRAKRLAIASQYEDTKAITLLQNGMDPELLELDAKKIDTAAKLQKTVQGMEDYDIQRRIFADGTKAFKEANPNATSQQEIQNRLQLLHEIKSGARSWQQEALRNFQLTNPNATPEQTQAFMQSLRGAGAQSQNPEWQFIQQKTTELMKPPEEGGKGMSRTDAMQEAERLWRASRSAPAREGTEADFVKKRAAELMKSAAEGGEELSQTEAEKKARSEWIASGKVNPGQLKTAGIIELQAKNPGMSIQEATKKYEEATKPGASMSEAAVDMNARLLIRGNPAAITNVGRGVQGGENLAAIKNKAAAILMEERKLTADQAAEVVNQNTAAFMGDKRGASNLGLRMSTIFGAATTALATADRVIETSEKVDRTSFSDLNKVLLSAQRRTGGTEVIDFGIAVNTLVNNYARAIGGGSAALTDTARREAHELLQQSWSKGQIKSAVAQLKRELYFELEGAKEAQKAWQTGSTPFPEGVVSDPSSTVIEYDNKGNRVK